MEPNSHHILPEDGQHNELIDSHLLSQLSEATVSSVLTSVSSALPSSAYQLVSIDVSQIRQHPSTLSLLKQSNSIHQASLHNQHQHLHQQQFSIGNREEDPSELQHLPSIIEVLAEEGANEIQTQTEISSISLPSLEQCCICSANYEKPHRIYPQPDFNRLLSKLLDIMPNSLPSGKSFFGEYVPVCISCAKKIKKYERLRNEMDVIKQEVISAMTDSFLYIQQNNTPIAECLKEPFLRRWVNSARSSSTKRKNNPSTSTPTFVKPARVLPKEHYASINMSTAPSVVNHVVSVDPNNVKVGPWQLAGEVNIFTSDDGAGTETPQYATAYVADLVDSNEYSHNQHQSMVNESDQNCSGSTIIYSNTASKKQNSNEVEEGIRKTKQSQPAKAKQHERPPFFCQSCGRVFSILKSLRHHCVECTEETKPTNCTICQADFSESTWLDVKFHVDLAHSDQCSLDKCRHCRKEFLPNTINQHQCIYESSGSLNAIKPHQEYKCDFCEKVYYHTNSLGNHVRRHHLGEKSFTCEICSRVFSASAILNSHMTIHRTTPIKKTSYKCDVCGIYCSTSWGLKQHTTIHTGTKHYQCPTCGKKFRLYQSWKTHEVVHTRERNHSCEVCGKLFSLYSTKQRHLRRHNNPLPELPKLGESCSICGDVRSFIKLSALKQHMLREHPGTKEQFEICRRVDKDDKANELQKKPRSIRARRSTSKSLQRQQPATARSKPQKRRPSTRPTIEVDEDSVVEIIVKEEVDSDIEEICLQRLSDPQVSVLKRRKETAHGVQKKIKRHHSS